MDEKKREKQQKETKFLADSTEGAPEAVDDTPKSIRRETKVTVIDYEGLATSEEVRRHGPLLTEFPNDDLAIETLPNNPRTLNASVPVHTHYYFLHLSFFQLAILFVPSNAIFLFFSFSVFFSGVFFWRFLFFLTKE